MKYTFLFLMVINAMSCKSPKFGDKSEEHQERFLKRNVTIATDSELINALNELALYDHFAHVLINNHSVEERTTFYFNITDTEKCIYIYQQLDNHIERKFSFCGYKIPISELLANNISLYQGQVSNDPSVGGSFVVITDKFNNSNISKWCEIRDSIIDNPEIKEVSRERVSKIYINTYYPEQAKTIYNSLIIISNKLNTYAK